MTERGATDDGQNPSTGSGRDPSTDSGQAPSTGSGRDLAEARETIARQADEIERLRRELGAQNLATELRDIFSLAALTGTIGSPVSHSRLLEMIVNTAADVINARAASLFLIDYQKQELVFEVALGEKSEEVKKFRLPLGHGVAGLVAATGQPLAISDTQSDTRDAADISQAIGYVPKNILCVPLLYEERVIGVLELLDKEGGDTFSAADMETLALFANQAAVAIEQSLNQRNLAGLIGGVLQLLGGIPEDRMRRLQEQADSFAVDLEEDETYRQALDLARLIQQIAHQGENELSACRSILQAFADYLAARPRPADAMVEPW